MKSLTGVIVGVIIVVVIILGVLHYQKQDRMADENQSGNGGSLYIGITDASADIKNVNDIDLSIKKVEVHSASKGWMTVSSSSKKYSLLALKARGATEFYAKKDGIESGSYDRVRVTMGDAVVRTKTKGDVKAVMPASQIVMNGSVNVKEGENTHIKLDFLADKSLHTAADGQYVFAPVVKTEMRSNASVAVNTDSTVTVSGGSVDSDTTVGIDLDGSSRLNFQLNTDAALKVESSVGSTLKFMLGDKSYMSDNSKDREGEGSSMDLKLNAEGSSKTDTTSGTGSSNTKGNGGMNINLGQ